MKNNIKGKQALAITLLSFSPIAALAQASVNQADSLKLQAIHDSLDLQGVEVVAQKPVVRMTTDKMTYNVQQDEDAKTMTLLDMLRKVPMVTVDGQDNVTVKGSASFKVYVDGKPNQMFQNNFSQVAKSMPASMVKSIDVITSPGAKYDAEGTSGVLDIKLVHQSGQPNSDCNNCYNGNVELSLSNKGERANAYIGGQHGKLTYSAMGMFAWQDFGNLKVTNTRLQQTSLGESLQTTDVEFKQKHPFSFGNFTLGYALDSLSTINVSAGVNGGYTNQNMQPRNSFSGGPYGNGFSYVYNSNQRNHFMGANASADYQRWLNADHTSSLTLSYLFDYNPARNRTWTIYNN